MLRVLIIDDEKLARDGLRALLGKHADVHIAGEAGDVDAALDLVKRERPDAMFLDIRMPGKSGFEMFRELAEPPLAVLVTAYSEYAVEAFDVEAVDYLLKPVSPARLGQSLDRLRSALGNAAPPPPHAAGERICLRSPERTVVAPASDLVLLAADRDFTKVHVAGTSPLFICQSLGSFERSLPSPPFLRLDRSTIVNLARIRSISVSPTRGASVHFTGLAVPVPLGRAALKRLREAMPHSLAGLGNGNPQPAKTE